jgi:broad specificity phosphatase PhoE
MARLILLRHGQSLFNLFFTATRRDPGLADPPLSPAGRAQAEEAAARLAARPIRRLIASPYTRALETARPFAARLGLPIEVSAGVRERFAFACDIGRPRSELEPAWPEADFGDLPERWWPSRVESAEVVRARAEHFAAHFAALSDEEGEVLVVAHWGFILALTGRSLANGEAIELDPPLAVPREVIWHP